MVPFVAKAFGSAAYLEGIPLNVTDRVLDVIALAERNNLTLAGIELQEVMFGKVENVIDLGLERGY